MYYKVFWGYMMGFLEKQNKIECIACYGLIYIFIYLYLPIDVVLSVGQTNSFCMSSCLWMFVLHVHVCGVRSVFMNSMWLQGFFSHLCSYEADSLTSALD